MADRESSAGLRLALGVLVLGALAAYRECQGKGLRLSSTGGIMGQYRPGCVPCAGRGKTTLASTWFGRR